MYCGRYARLAVTPSRYTFNPTKKMCEKYVEGEYSSLSGCMTANAAYLTADCVSNACVSTNTGQGRFSSWADCMETCPNGGFECRDFACVRSTSGGGMSYGDCVKQCTTTGIAPGSAVLSQPLSPTFYVPIGTFTATTVSFDGIPSLATLQGTGTVQIIGGTGACAGDSASAAFVLLDQSGTVLFRGNQNTTSRSKDSGCVTPMLVRGARKGKVRASSNTTAAPFVFEPGRAATQLQPGAVYTVAIEVQHRTDDSIGVTWTNVAVTEYAGNFKWQQLPSFTVNLGNRLIKDASSNFYYFVGSFIAAGTSALLLGSGTIGIGSGSGTDRLRASAVIKQGNAPTGTAPSQLLQVYEGPVSGEATRNKDAEFLFTSNASDFAQTTPGMSYSIYIKLFVNTDDTVYITLRNPYLVEA